MGSIASDKDVINIHEDEYSNTIQFYVNKDASTRDTQKPWQIIKFKRRLNSNRGVCLRLWSCLWIWKFWVLKAERSDDSSLTQLYWEVGRPTTSGRVSYESEEIRRLIRNWSWRVQEMIAGFGVIMLST